MEITEFICHRCGRHIVFEVTGVGVGYGLDEDDNQLCYPCCAEIDIETMDEEGYFVLYLAQRNYNGHSLFELTNWPGSLRIKIDEMKTGRHNWAGSRTDVWFRDYQGRKWWGRQYGDNSELTYCKRLRGGE